MESSLKSMYLEFCQQLLKGELGTRVELQESFAATIALAENGEDSLFIISQPADVRHIMGHTRHRGAPLRKHARTYRNQGTAKHYSFPNPPKLAPTLAGIVGV